MILGTAGHIDHGKTALVRALTGVDTDRLAEEKRRGITIELGFAPLALDDGATVSIVDVPGHERFVDTMIAGAWPLDAAVLVVAATEGVMPQTREHCAVLRALRIPVIAVALTHVDRIAGMDRAAIESTVRADLVACGVPTPVPIVRTVAPAGDGIAALRATIDAARRSIAHRDVDDLARFVVDRAFTLRGIGTVATGTLCAGRVALGDRVRVLPGARESRIRAIQAHGAPVEFAEAGGRVGLALADVAPIDVPRGATLVSDAAWRPTSRLIVRLDGDAPLPTRGGVLHVAGAIARARVTVIDAERRVARLTLDRPVVARARDRAVVRAEPGAGGVHGAVVVDPLPGRVPGATVVDASGTARLEAFAAAAGARGVPLSTLAIRLGLSPAVTATTIASAAVVRCGDRLVARPVVDDLGDTVIAAVERWSREHPFAAGVSMGELGTLVNATPGLLTHVVARAASAGRLTSDRGVVALDSAVMPAESAALLARVLHLLETAGLEPPTVAELVRAFGADAESVVRHAERAGNLVRLGDVRCYAAPVLGRVVGRLVDAMQSGREYTPAELREVLEVSRKYLIPLLEYCDSIGVTVRRSGGRVLVDVSSR